METIRRAIDADVGKKRPRGKSGNEGIPVRDITFRRVRLIEKHPGACIRAERADLRTHDRILRGQ